MYFSPLVHVFCFQNILKYFDTVLDERDDSFLPAAKMIWFTNLFTSDMCGTEDENVYRPCLWHAQNQEEENNGTTSEHENTLI